MDSSKRFNEGGIDRYGSIPRLRGYLSYAAMTQILEAVDRASTTDTVP
jgi:branched-chain amino acid transport system substrate-binding protein